MAKRKRAYKKAGKDEPLEGWVATRGVQALLESRCVEASLREVQGLARPRNKKEECLQMEQAIAAAPPSTAPPSMEQAIVAAPP